MQPPSGGCVLKQLTASDGGAYSDAAAFGRLCVETRGGAITENEELAAAFGRLCVETSNLI